MRCTPSIAILLVFTLVCSSVQPAVACIWDSDTLAAEIKGVPDVVDVIVGRFERQPAKYYEMRLERVTKLLEEDPKNLAAYDDAGAACDRLGRGDEAIAWMEKKKAVLEEMDSSNPTVVEHRYRYLANVGTFWVHRWFSRGADRTQLDEVRTGRDFIAQAIELNPDAHFGREKYQLMAIDLILEEPAEPTEDSTDRTKELPLLLKGVDPGDVYHAVKDNGSLAANGMADAVRGLSGLIALGNAWESVDVYHALSYALQAEGRSQPAFLATQRAIELAEQGRESIAADAPRGAELQEWLRSYVHHPLDDRPKEQLKAYYREARAAADQWNSNRADHMERQLAAGRHPDTHPDFWQGWNDAPPLPPLLEVEGGPNQDRAIRRAAIAGVVFLAAIFAGIVGIVFAVAYLLRSRKLTEPGAAAMKNSETA